MRLKFLEEYEEKYFEKIWVFGIENVFFFYVLKEVFSLLDIFMWVVVYWDENKSIVVNFRLLDWKVS